MDLKDIKFRLVRSHGKFKVGDEVSIADVLSPDAIHIQKDKQDKKQFSKIKHNAVELLAHLSGVREYSDPTMLVEPKIENSMTTVFMRKFERPTWKQKEKKWVLSGEYERPASGIEIGESSTNNVQGTGKYFVSMAYKRAWDRGVLNCLEAFELHSDIEGDFGSNDEKPTMDSLEEADRKAIANFVKIIGNAKSEDALNIVGDEIQAALKESKFSEEATTVLRAIYYNRKQAIGKV